MIKTLDDLYTICWQSAQLGEAFDLLAQYARLPHTSCTLPFPADAVQSEEQLEQWVQFAGDQLGIELEPIEINYSEAERFVRQGAPALIRILHESQSLYLALLRGGNGQVVILTPQLKTVRVEASVIAYAIQRPLLLGSAAEINVFLGVIGVAEDRHERVRAALNQELFGTTKITAGWILRLSPANSLLQQAHSARLERPILSILLIQIAIQVFSLLGWVTISQQVLRGSFDEGWLLAWALLLFTVIPLQMRMSVSAGEFSTVLGSIIKQRLIYGTLKLNPQALRHEGIGHFLGRIMDANVVETTTIANVFILITAFIQILSASAIFVASGSWPLALLLLVWTLLISFASLLDYGNARAWYEAYRRMTNYLVEAMIGHRTRLAQQHPHTWHADEDIFLERYLQLSQRMDSLTIAQSAVNGSWLLVGLVGVGLIFTANTMPLQTLAISLGGVLLAQGALQSIYSTFNNTQNALQSWQQVKPLFAALSNAERPSSALLLETIQAPDATPKPILTAKNLSFRYREQGRWVIKDCNLTVYGGDRLLLEGSSGGGKSTLATLIAGLHPPSAGLLMLGSYDQQSLSVHDWRRRVVLAPQFHENHIFTETFAFNLLMGRRYPPTAADLQEAMQVCGELGLSDLLQRMPSGLQQMVGESGWQLSHGERSRVYIARALLQGSEVIILDESFGALDAETLQVALECVLRRAKTLIVIAHP